MFFFLLFQSGGPLSAVPMILAGGATIMAAAGIMFFREPATWPRLLGIALALAGLVLLRSPTGIWIVLCRVFIWGNDGVLGQHADIVVVP